MTSGVKFLKKSMTSYLGKMFKEEEGKDKQNHNIHLGGYLNTEVRKQNYAQLSPKEQRELITNTFNDILLKNDFLAQNKRVGVRRFILSPPPSLMEKLSKQDQEAMIKETVKTTMKNFKDNFYKNLVGEIRKEKKSDDLEIFHGEFDKVQGGTLVFDEISEFG